jgi:hypothetical protein
LPLLIVLSTFLFLLLIFLLCILLIRRRRGIVLRDSDSPTDMSREDLVAGEGGFEALETRWLEGATEVVRRAYLRAKGTACSPLSLGFSGSLTVATIRVPSTIPAQFTSNRHHTISVLVNPGKGCLSLVF